MSRGMVWHAQQLARAAGQSINYDPGRDPFTIPDATLGSSDHEYLDETGVPVRTQVTDWIIPRDRFSNGFEPAPGHRIVHTVGSVTTTYEVQNVGGEGCWRPCGSSPMLLRVHVRQIPNAS